VIQLISVDVLFASALPAKISYGDAWDLFKGTDPILIYSLYISPGILGLAYCVLMDQKSFMSISNSTLTDENPTT